MKSPYLKIFLTSEKHAHLFVNKLYNFIFKFLIVRKKNLNHLKETFMFLKIIDSISIFIKLKQG